jgi:hypothetical protein
MRKPKLMRPQDIPPVPAEAAHALQYPAGVDLNGSAKCRNCGKEKPLLKLKYLGGLDELGYKYKCKSGRCKPNKDMSPPCTHPDNVSKKRWKIDVRITGEIEEL